MTTAVFYHSPDLPWTISAEDQRRFRRILNTVVAVTLICSVIFPLLPTPETPRDIAPPMPPRYARMLLEHKPPPPPVVKPRPEPKKPEIKKPEIQKPEIQKIEPPKAQKKLPAPETKKAAPAPKAKASARERASHAGLLAFSEDLSSLRSSNVMAPKRQPLKKAAASESPKIQRAILTQRAKQGGTGIDTARLSRDTGAKQSIGTHQTEQVRSKALPLGKQPHQGSHSRDGVPPRSDEDIQLVFDRNKGKLYGLYNRALRTNAGLRGKVVLRLSINPAGNVVSCRIISIEL